jgi:hypothetical protein
MTWDTEFIGHSHAPAVAVKGGYITPDTKIHVCFILEKHDA